jgi:hypothetical protein
MKTVSLMGGLGNQMFQYAFGQAWDKRVRYDLSWFDEVKNSPDTTQRKYELGAFNLRLRKASALSRLLFKQKKVHENPQNVYNPSYLRFKKAAFVGYFQTDKYFKDIHGKLLSDFSLRVPLNSANMEMLAKIKNLGNRTVAVHIRRGDYIKHADIHIPQTSDYYTRAIDYIKNHVKAPYFFVFSDDLKWAAENIDFGKNYTFVDTNDTDAAVFDLELMKNCAHNIIANSSFSWWGAWLNENPDKTVVAPRAWHKDNMNGEWDTVPKEWISI